MKKIKFVKHTQLNTFLFNLRENWCPSLTEANERHTCV
ncbi:hypothetical protein JOC74_001372 [Bacillus capparidis]|uniref:Uncharacterized protein n=1 Tax=Bacillus capparidis TaxID=1840411 RepID=A0ABS4CTJ5_9BACI|nr:hypothetical protein [Bacillus capparidis]